MSADLQPFLAEAIFDLLRFVGFGEFGYGESENAQLKAKAGE